MIFRFNFHSFLLFFVGFFCFFAEPTLAISEEREIVAQQLYQELWAPCCWKKVIADDFSEEAVRMKAEVRDLLEKGQNKEDVIKFYVSKFGDKIVRNTGPENSVIWALPAIFFALAFLCILRFRRKKRYHLVNVDSFQSKI